MIKEQTHRVFYFDLTLKLKKDLDFYIEVSNKAKRLYKKEFTKEKMLQLLQDD